jgi:hypothetical protein
MMVNVELIGKKKPIAYIIILVIWNIGILLFFSSFLFNNMNFVRFSSLILLISFFIWIIGNLLIKSYILVGNIEISSDSIKVNKDSEVLDFDLFKTRNLVLQYVGSKGDPYGLLGSMRINDGSKNTISFEYEGVPYKFRFLVTDRHFLNYIYKFV